MNLERDDGAQRLQRLAHAVARQTAAVREEARHKGVRFRTDAFGFFPELQIERARLGATRFS